MQEALLIAKLFINSYLGFLTLETLLGVGTALMYPTFLVAIAEYALTPQWAHSVGIFRLWLDAGYVVGALLTGILTD